MAAEFRRMAREYDKAGDHETARKLMERARYWQDVASGRRLPDTKRARERAEMERRRQARNGNRFFRNKFLNILTWIVLIVVPPAGVGILIAEYFEVLLVAIVLVPGFIAFFGQGLKNGANAG